MFEAQVVDERRERVKCVYLFMGYTAGFVIPSLSQVKQLLVGEISGKCWLYESVCFWVIPLLHELMRNSHVYSVYAFENYCFTRFVSQSRQQQVPKTHLVSKNYAYPMATCCIDWKKWESVATFSKKKEEELGYWTRFRNSCIEIKI